MSISVTQEEAKFRPVTIVIDDVRTANLLRFMLLEMLSQNPAVHFENCISNINSFADACHARAEIESIHKALQQICK